MQVLGGGKCLVTFTPEQAITHEIEVTFNNDQGADAELAVSVQGPVEDIPVKVTGNVKNGFVAQFIPNAVGLHVVLVEYNGVAVGGTPFYCKVRDHRENNQEDFSQV